MMLVELLLNAFGTSPHLATKRPQDFSIYQGHCLEIQDISNTYLLLHFIYYFGVIHMHSIPMEVRQQLPKVSS